MSENLETPAPSRGHGGARPGAGRPKGTTKSSNAAIFNEARARKEAALADLRELELATKRGLLVDVKEVETEWRSMLGAVRSGMLAVASRVAPDLVALTDERQIEDVVTAAVHEAMEAIARG